MPDQPDTGNHDMKVLLISTAVALTQPPSGGRGLLSHLTEKALMDICGPRLSVLRVVPQRLRGLKAVNAAFRGQVDGVSAEVVAKVGELVESAGIHTVILDGSGLGFLCKILKFRSKKIDVITYFHNCEARFFWGAFRHFKTLHSFGVLIANFAAERLAVRYSDRLVCLNSRDSNQLHRIYGRRATDLSPMSLEDQLANSVAVHASGDRRDYALFVGGGFYANQAGILWYSKYVAPFISIRTRIVGRGLESIKDELEQNAGIEVIGAVDDLAPWYAGASFVVAPIFDGSGMKTKVAEALMFGKRVVGTVEAFAGYEEVIERVGCVCETADAFVAAIAAESCRPHSDIDASLRSIYKECYSFAAAKARWAGILGEKLAVTNGR